MTVVPIFSSMAVPKDVQAILTAHNVYCMVTEHVLGMLAAGDAPQDHP